MGETACGNWLRSTLYPSSSSLRSLTFTSPRSSGSIFARSANTARVICSYQRRAVDDSPNPCWISVPSLITESPPNAMMAACRASTSPEVPVATSAESPRLPDRLPVILFDVMDTLVRDPFYEDMPRYFGMSMKELLQQKHPSAWVEFETGQLSEEELGEKFFADGREFDYQGLKECMVAGYCFLDGMEGLLGKLRGEGYAMHAFTNYPCWYEMIESKLELSQFLPWTFVSCHMGRRKPDREWYVEAARHLQRDPQDCLFVDDRLINVEAARAVGMKGILFQGTEDLEKELNKYGVSW